jgi:excisionase family DNA binding protein
MEIAQIPTRTQDRPLTFSLPRAAAMLGICIDTLRAYIARGEIRTIRLGARQRVPLAEIERILAGAQD